MQHDVTTGKVMTYSEMVSNVTKMASALKKRGLKLEDVVLMMASNYIETAVSMFSIMKAGGSCASLTLNLFPGNLPKKKKSIWFITTCFIVAVWHEEDIKKRASSVRAKFVVTDEARAGRVLDAVKQLDCVQEVFVIGQAEGCTPIDELFKDDGAGWQR